MNATKWILTVAFAALVVAPAPAAFITSLYGTGLNNDGTVRTNNQAELHYIMLAGSPIAGTPVVYTDAGGFPIGPWLNDASSATSRWIAPTTVRDHPAGDYTFRTTFDLTGFLPGTASIAGKWATDNAGLNILLNGISLGFTSSGFTAYSSFAVTSGNPAFLAGLNNLDFVINNAASVDANPAGLRVEVTGDATVAAVPVPPTALLAVVGFGTVGLGRLVRRRRA